MNISNSFQAPDGVKIAWRETGQGRPLLLIHGFMSEAETNWIKYGHAAALADAGYRVIMPDLRAHGMSGKPHDPKYYPRDILADDQFALLGHLDITDYDLGGYSLGGRTVSRMLARGAAPGRAVISGMGLEGLTQTGKRSAHFRHVFDNLGQHEQGAPAWMAEAFLKTTGGDPAALRHILIALSIPMRRRLPVGPYLLLLYAVNKMTIMALPPILLRFCSMESCSRFQAII